MNIHSVEGHWDQIKGKVKQTWAKLTDDDLKAIEGNRDILIGKLMVAYGYTKDEAQRNVDDMFNSIQRDTLS